MGNFNRLRNNNIGGLVLIKILLKQHLGEPCQPIVSTGDIIKKGQLIARKQGLSVNIHSSVEGTVVDVNNSFIMIRPNINQPEKYVELKKTNNILEKVKEAGIVGAGGAGFPTYIKLDTDLKGGTVIANSVECEPLLNHNIKQLTEEPQLIYRGLCYVKRVTNASKGILAIKRKNQEAIKAFRKLINAEDKIEIVELEDLYPMGEERAVIRETLGVLLKPDQLPLEARALVLNVETLARVTEAVEFRKPVISKNITVTGRFKNGKRKKVLMNVPLGISVKEVVDNVGGLDNDYGEIIMGGPFMGYSVEPDDVISKTSGGIIVTMEFMQEKRKMGLLVCACGAGEDRLREIATKMNADVVGVERCKQAVESRGILKCDDPGNCPGQAEKILSLKKKGAEVLLISNCSDCTNTVMSIAPKLKIPVYHCTDHVMRTVGHSLIRRLK